MSIHIEASFDFRMDGPTDVLLQFEAAAIPEQTILNADTRMTDCKHCARVAAQDDIGDRIWVRADGRFEVHYVASVEIDRLLPDLATLGTLEPHEMPAEAVQYLFDSRYCPADKFQTFVQDEFGGTEGGERVIAIREWLERKFTYAPGSSGPDTGALESFIGRRGICRDYAHTLVTLARASAIPARYVACYAPGVTPQDFHAVAEVFLKDTTTEGGGAWHIVDATGMADPAQTVKIGVGRDAADVSFLTSFGLTTFGNKSVHVGA